MKKELQIRVVFDRKHVATLSTDPTPRPGLIQLEARYEGRRSYISVASVYLDQFGRYNKKTRTTTGETVHNRADSERINSHIQQLRAAMIADFDRCRALGLTFSLDRLSADTHTGEAFPAWAARYVANMPVSESTRATKTTYIKVIDASDIFHTFDDLTAANVLAFDSYLRTKPRHFTSRPLSPGFVHNVHGFLHTLSVAALRDGHITADPYRDFKNPKAKSAPRSFLSPDQIQLLANAPCIDTAATKVSLRDARDLFLLQIYTGLAYIDVQTAPWPTARASGVLQAQRRKTRTPYIVRISPAARAILDRWEWQPPRISSISLNEALQLVACQAITGQAAVGLRSLSTLPADVVDRLKALKVTARTGAQNDTPQIHALLLLLLATGVSHEGLSRADLNAAKRSHVLTYTYRGHTHHIDLTPEALRLLDGLGWRLPAVSYATVTNTLRRLIVSTVFPALSTHIGRHTFGTVAINSGVPVAVLQRIMGHSNPNTTLIYAKLQADTILDAFDRIDQQTDPTPK